MRTLALLPVKRFSSAKQRLASTLPAGARHLLAQAMFADVLGALRRVRELDAIAVVTDDIEAEVIALGDGAIVLKDERPEGQSQAALIGVAYAEAKRFERVALVPGDTPLVDPAELDELLERAQRERLDVAIVPDRHRSGTNALVIAPPSRFTPSFGDGSLERHVAAAREAGLTHGVLDVASLALDIDTSEDLVALWSQIAYPRERAQRTRGALSQLERVGARTSVERRPSWVGA